MVQTFTWQEPKLAHTSLDELEKSKLLQNLAINDAIVRVLQRGGEASGAAHLMCNAAAAQLRPLLEHNSLPTMLKQAVSEVVDISDCIRSLCRESDVPPGAVEAVLGQTGSRAGVVPNSPACGCTTKLLERS